MHTQLAWSEEASHCPHAIILAHSNMPSSDVVIVIFNPGKPVTGTLDSNLVIVKEKTSPFGVNLMRSPVSYRVAQMSVQNLTLASL